MENQKLPSPWRLIKKSFEIYFKKENFLYLTKVNLLGLLVSMVIISPLLVFGFLGAANPNLSNLSFMKGSGINFPLIIFVSIAAVASIIWGVWFQVAIIKAVINTVSGKIVGVKDTYKNSWPKVGKYFWTALEVGFLTAFGFILLIIPGILVLVWYSFSRYIVVEEEVGSGEALKRSKALVKGNFWPVFGRGIVFVLFYILLQIIFSFVKILGPLLLTLISPLYVLLPYLLYQELKRIKDGGSVGDEGLVSEGELA